MIDKCCSACGAKVVEYKHGLSKSLMRCLYVAAKQGRTTFNPNNLNLNYNQKSNFQKLRYWGLVEKSDANQEKGGIWFITQAGWDFLSGLTKQPKHAWTFRGERVRFDGDEIDVMKVTGGWRYKSDYAADALPH